VQEILFETGRSAMTDKASEEDYDYPQFPPSLTQSMSRVTSVRNPPRSLPKGFRHFLKSPRHKDGLSTGRATRSGRMREFTRDKLKELITQGDEEFFGCCL
jgi:hypothetical protein